MKTMQATDAKNHFGELLEDIASGPVLIQYNGQDAAVIMSFAEYERCFLTASSKEFVKRHHEESIERFGPLYDALSSTSKS
ncbi:MAG: type II toxin-antitoxin system Phd/YefM family antitoxin [Gammaproteobacteria bacterium]|nr:type II toxin-antitoxin system Phd/YefM family antitoxin [Gammaproteobacteria bacterium]